MYTSGTKYHVLWRYTGTNKTTSLTNALSVVGQRGGTSLHTSVTPQEECTSQSFHLFHLQEAAGTHGDWRDDETYSGNNSSKWENDLKSDELITDAVWTADMTGKLTMTDKVCLFDFWRLSGQGSLRQQSDKGDPDIPHPSYFHQPF